MNRSGPGAGKRLQRQLNLNPPALAFPIPTHCAIHGHIAVESAASVQAKKGATLTGPTVRSIELAERLIGLRPGVRWSWLGANLQVSLPPLAVAASKHSADTVWSCCACPTLYAAS